MLSGVLSGVETEPRLAGIPYVRGSLGMPIFRHATFACLARTASRGPPSGDLDMRRSHRRLGPRDAGMPA